MQNIKQVKGRVPYLPMNYKKLKRHKLYGKRFYKKVNNLFYFL